MGELIENVLKVLENILVVDRMKLIEQPLYDDKLSPVVTAPEDTVKDMQQTICNLRDQLKVKDSIIAPLQKDVFSIKMKLVPPLSIEDTEVSHHLGRVAAMETMGAKG